MSVPPAVAGGSFEGLRLVEFGRTQKHSMATKHEEVNESEPQSQEIDSKYRLIILAAKRSKQLQRGARPRIDIDAVKHKPTRIALEEVIRGAIHFHITTDDDETQEEA